MAVSLVQCAVISTINYRRSGNYNNSTYKITRNQISLIESLFLYVINVVIFICSSKMSWGYWAEWSSMKSQEKFPLYLSLESWFLSAHNFAKRSTQNCIIQLINMISNAYQKDTFIVQFLVVCLKLKDITSTSRSSQ